MGEGLWRIELAGSVSVHDPSGQPVRIASRKAIELLAFLAVRRTAIVDRDTVADALWPEIDSVSARNRLKQTLSVLRREAPAIPIEVHGKHEIELDHGAIQVDLAVVRERMRWLRLLTGHDRVAAVASLRPTLRQDLLPGFSGAWAIAEQTQWAKWRETLAAEPEGEPGPFRFVDALPGTHVDLVGRESELRAIHDWFSNGTKRWLALVGAPGVGKSRLTLEVVRAEPPSYDAVLLLSTTQTSETHWTERLGQALGLQGESNVTDRVVSLLLGFRAPLLALDDFDQASPEMKRWAETIVNRVPQLRILVSARVQPADSRFEIIQVQPLEDEAERRLLFSRFAEKHGLAAHALAGQAEAISALSERLEGLPLAIEVAAGWLPLLSAKNLLARLESRPDYVVGRASGGRASLADCVGKLMDGLSDESRDALRFLSICHGGCGELLAAEVLGDDWPWYVRSLVETSLAYTTRGVTGPRHMVLQAIRDTVRMALKPEELSDMQLRHAKACVQLSREAYWGFCNGERRARLDWVRDEGDNLLFAYRRCREDTTLLADGYYPIERMGSLFGLIGRFAELHAIREPLRELAVKHADGFPKDVSLLLAGHWVFEQEKAGRPIEAELLLFHAVTEAKALSNPEVLANIYDSGRKLFWDRQDWEQALSFALLASENYERAGYQGPALWLQGYAASAEKRLGRFEARRQRIARNRARAKEIGDDNTLGVYDKEFAGEQLALGNVQEALALAESSVEAFKRAGEMVTLGEAYVMLGHAHLAASNVSSAKEAYREAEECTPAEYPKQVAQLEGLRKAIEDARSRPSG